MKVNKRNLAVGVLAVFLMFSAYQAPNNIFYGIYLVDTYESTDSIWHPRNETDEKVGFLLLASLMWACLFVYIFFTKVRTSGGILEGIKYGFYMGLFFVVPMSLNIYVSLSLPQWVLAAWVAYGMAQIMFCGAILGLLYRLRS